MSFLTLDFDFGAVERQLTELGRKQLPFATAKSLTQAAQAVQQQVRADMPKRFAISRKWIINGIRIEPARKSRLSARVYSRDKFMGRQEYGGEKRSQDTQVWRWKGKLAIPTDEARGGKPHGVVPKKNWPENLAGALFQIRTRDGLDLLCLRRRGQVQVMYVLEDEVEVDARLKLRETGDRIANVVFPKLFGTNMARAIAQSRRQATGR
ncbi:hypothetical protein [Jeongeupia naejangsanensis]|uniref:Uncharacterized protein n=1 Tax=Jeongeupia naejangsanensis TaxID=613195 RepID=A0ABS2BF76_9NEIS|nr:hypothetical protein [Jeongeupia naejangsanensis]MBM3114267.1 hypothetical protein [Jeongeupia naejangsanensis]